jgi:hypothetical protein
MPGTEHRQGLAPMIQKQRDSREQNFHLPFSETSGLELAKLRYALGFSQALKFTSLLDSKIF